MIFRKQEVVDALVVNELYVIKKIMENAKIYGGLSGAAARTGRVKKRSININKYIWRNSCG